MRFSKSGNRGWPERTREFVRRQDFAELLDKLGPELVEGSRAA
jgi:hypothetical protein